MTSLFKSILDMSITASYVALAVIALRMFLKKIPKIFSYILWLPVLVRLVMPFSFNSRLSIFRFLKPEAQTSTRIMNYAQNNIGFIQNTTVDGADGINAAVTTSVSSAPIANANPIHTIMGFASYIWVIGIVALLIYSIISYLKVINNVKTATLIDGNVFETDRIMSPFVCGFIRPRIFIPTGMNENELSYIMKHEQTHIKRLDYIVKPFAFLALILHWFNPLMWLSFALMSKDMEMSCDESVIKQMGNKIKGSYSNSLLSLSAKRSGLMAGSPLAFGESNIKSRIKNILNYKKPAFWVAAIVIVITAVLIVSFTANPRDEQVSTPTSTAKTSAYSGYNVEALIANKTLYVGNNSKVVALIDAMALPEGIVRDTVELKTDKAPYEITINLIMNDSSVVMVDGAISAEAFYPNSILLFSLIDNVEAIHYKLFNKTGKYDGAIYTQTYTREMTNEVVGGDVRPYAYDTNTLKKLIDRLRSMSFVNVPVQTGEQIEKYLEIIMSSPKESSNFFDYIKAHQKEYDSILGIGEEAYTYLHGKLSNAKGLRFQILIKLCKDLKINVTDDSQLTKDYYSKIQAIAIEFIERRGYNITVNSGIAFGIILPENYTESGNIGEFFYNKNEQSKKQGYDFTKFMGTGIYLHGYEITKDDTRVGFIFVLFSKGNIIGTWIDQSKDEQDLKMIINNLETYNFGGTPIVH